jgi:hypothetical protein
VISEIALLLPGEDDRPSRRDLILTARLARDAAYQTVPLQEISYTHSLYYTLHYVFLYPYGEPGRDIFMRLLDPRGNRIRFRISTQIFYRYLYYTRPHSCNIKYRGGRLFQ